MSRPVGARRAYAMFGMLLGSLPPAAIFARLLGYGADGSMQMIASDAVLFTLCLLINVISCAMGYLLGYAFSDALMGKERGSWTKMLLIVPLIGSLWGILTGSFSGLFYFGYGGIIGALLMLPIGMAGFLLFALFHRLLERGGMIEARHFLPLACGITSIIAAFILGL